MTKCSCPSVEQPDKGVSLSASGAEADSATVVAQRRDDAVGLRAALPDQTRIGSRKGLRRDTQCRAAVALHRRIERVVAEQLRGDVAVGGIACVELYFTGQEKCVDMP